MKLNNLISLAALVTATALPTLGSAQIRHLHPSRIHPSYVRPSYQIPYYSRTSYGYGPFYPSYIPGPSYQYFGAGGSYRAGGTTFHFGPGGGYTVTYPYGYSYPSYGWTRHRSHRGWR
jgi:hypothetical protein